jgi:hypothetical protein
MKPKVDGVAARVEMPLWAEQDGKPVTFGVAGAGTEWIYLCACGFRTVALIGESAAAGVQRVHRSACALASVRSRP